MNKFVLKAPFKPAGDQPQAIEKLVAGIKTGHKDQVLLGVTGSGKTMTMASVISKIQRPTLVISHNKTLAAQLAAEFQEFFPDNAVHYFVSYYDYYMPESYMPQTDTYIEKETSINEEIDRLRHAATQSLLTRDDVLIVASVSCIFGLGSPQEYENFSLKLKVGSPTPRLRRTGQINLTRKDILRKLLEMRYERNDIDLYRGRFRIRGNILDVFPAFALDEIYRISFKGDRVTKLEILDQLTLKPKKQETRNEKNKKTEYPYGRGNIQNRLVGAVEEVVIFPATHYVAPFDDLDEILKQVEKDKIGEVKAFEKAGRLIEAQRLSQRVDFDLEMIRNTGYCNGIENYSRYFDGRSINEPAFTLMNYYPKDYLMFIDESHMTVPQIRGMYAGDRSRKETLINYGFRLQAAFDNRPLKFEEFQERKPQTVYVSATPGPYEIDKSEIRNPKSEKKSKSKIQKPKEDLATSSLDTSRYHIAEQLIRPTGLLDPRIAVRPAKNQIDNILEEVHERIDKKQRVLITTMTKRMAEDLAEYLQEADIKAYYLHSDIDTLERLEILRDLRTGTYDVLVGINLLREGLDLPEVALVMILDADKEGFLRSDTALIQTMGRAARHAEGRVIMYADNMTGSMKRAIDEVKRRRKTQEAYNKKHGITPTTIKKEIKAGILGLVRHEATTVIEELPKNLNTLPKEEISHILKDLQNQMEMAAANLEFETAAMLRDQVKAINETIQNKKVAGAKKRGDQFAGLKALRK